MVGEISLMISRVYYQQLGDSRKICYNIYIRKRERYRMSSEKKVKKVKKVLDRL